MMGKKGFKGLLLLVWLLVGGEAAAPKAAAQRNPIIHNEADMNFPRNVTFTLEVDDSLEITTATLNYGIDKFSCVEVDTRVPVEMAGRTAQWAWEMVRSGNPPPGTGLWWQWELTDTAGNSYVSEEQTITLTDTRFNWQTISAPGVQLHWYDDAAVAQLLLDSAVTGLENLQADLGIPLQDEVQFFIYEDAAAMRDAVIYVQDWAGALAYNEYNTILMGVSPPSAETWGANTVRHELAHLVIGQFGRSCLGGGRPTWLEEGLAVFAEGPASGATTYDLDQGIKNNSFEPLRSLTGAFPAHSDAAGLAYSQSYSVVAYLVETYGQAKMRELILAMADGLGTEAALEQVYGFNMDGLEVLWREWLGAEARSIPPTLTPLAAAAIPTYAPYNAAQTVPTPPVAAATPATQVETSGRSAPCTLGLIPFLLLGLWRVRGERREGSSQ